MKVFHGVQPSRRAPLVRAAPDDRVAASPSVLLTSPNTFERWLRTEMRRAERRRSTLCVVTIGRTNDADSVGRAAEAIAKRLRTIPPEVIASIRHGNEPSVLLPDTEKADALRAVQEAANSVGIAKSAVVHCYPADVVASLVEGLDASHLPFVAVDPNERRLDVLVKRCIDVAVALMALTCLAPIMAAAAIAVAATSKGPVLFKQARIGRYGRSFVLYKFRSMHRDADERVHREHVTGIIKAQETSAAVWKQLDHDPRVTTVGKALRRLKIDEFPQFINVLKGDMSLVGPRPALSYEVSLYQPWHIRRLLQMAPGITGLWQVTGDRHTTFNDMVRMDLQYIDRWSNRMDLKILLATAALMLRRVLEQLHAKRAEPEAADTTLMSGERAVVDQRNAWSEIEYLTLLPHSGLPDGRAGRIGEGRAEIVRGG
jgi:lipopolysaccharide/colanic/teichoic acid biosynthesis glycosyltransferase